MPDLRLTTTVTTEKLRRRVDQPEDIVENVIASLAIGKELEGLGVAHGLLFLINL